MHDSPESDTLARESPWGVKIFELKNLINWRILNRNQKYFNLLVSEPGSLKDERIVERKSHCTVPLRKQFSFADLLYALHTV